MSKLYLSSSLVIYTSWERSLTSKHRNQSMIFPTFPPLVGYGRTLPREGIIITIKLTGKYSYITNQTINHGLEESDFSISQTSSQCDLQKWSKVPSPSPSIWRISRKSCQWPTPNLSGSRLMFSRRRFVNGSRNLKGISQVRKTMGLE